MTRHTKIVATIGPASREAKALEALIQAGVDVVRLNFSHGAPEEHRKVAEFVREISNRLQRPVGILGDLQGPKIRTGKFENGGTILKSGAHFILDAKCELGNAERVGIDYKNLPADVSAGDVLLLNDGQITLDVDRVRGDEIFTTVRDGGELLDHKGINRQGGGLSAPALTPKDIEDIRTAAQIGVDFLAVSFPKSAADMYMARQLMLANGGHALVIAKIERVEAVAAIEEILDASDGIMVARGDLAVETGEAAVPSLQKRMIRLAREKNKIAITATQMMESMVNAPTPTRAEVSDVANAVLDGTDAVMLSTETAMGKYPVKTVEVMARVCLDAEKSAPITLDYDFLNRTFDRIDQSISMASLFAAYHLHVKAIAAFTASGSTALWMSRLNCGIPIYGLTYDPKTRFKMTLFRAVTPMLIEDKRVDHSDEIRRDAEQPLIDAGVVKKDDLIVLAYGERNGIAGGTNTLSIVRAGDYFTSPG